MPAATTADVLRRFEGAIERTLRGRREPRARHSDDFGEAFQASPSLIVVTSNPAPPLRSPLLRAPAHFIGEYTYRMTWR